MNINIVGFLGQACLVMAAVGAVLYGLLWIVKRITRDRKAKWII
jgi:hypothetical protein